MKKFQVAASLAMFLLLTACGGGKKVKIMASGKLKVEGNVVNLQPGTTHNEEELAVSGDKITVNDGSKTYDVAVPSSGLYILNLKTDTIVGAYQRIGVEANTAKVTQEELVKKIDSLEQLMAGKNVSAQNRNFCIAPGSIARISDNLQSQIIGPFLKMPSSFEGGKEYEIYKFSTNKEVHEVVQKLKAFQ